MANWRKWFDANGHKVMYAADIKGESGLASVECLYQLFKARYEEEKFGLKGESDD